MSAGSLGWEEAIQKMQVFSAAGGGAFLPAPSTEIPAPQDAKLSVLAPEPSDSYEKWHALPRRNTEDGAQKIFLAAAP